MIKRIKELPYLPCCPETARIEGLYNSYKDNIGTDIFVQEKNSIIQSVIGGIDNSYSLIELNCPNYEELNDFFLFSTAEVFCSEKVSSKLNCKDKKYCELYRYNEHGLNLGVSHKGKISDIYCLLAEGIDGDIELPDFDNWYSDFCIRYNHKAAEYASIEEGTAICGFMTQKASLISGISVKKSERNKGSGSHLLRLLISNIRYLYPESEIFAATKTANEFYAKNGFVNTGRVALCKY